MLRVFLIIFFCINLCMFNLYAADPAKPGAAPAAPGQPGADAPPAADAGAINTTEISSGIKTDLQLIFFAGVGGAVLGLSTLSFVDKPANNLNRITFGFSVGVIGAAIYMLYKTTTKSMTGSGFSKLTAPMGQQSVDDVYPLDEYDNGEDGGEPEEENNEDDNYDEDFYGSINNKLFLTSYSAKRGLQLGVPLINVTVNEKNTGYNVTANLFRMSF